MKTLFILSLALIFGCSKTTQNGSSSLGVTMADCKIYRTGCNSTYYLLNICGNKVNAKFIENNIVKMKSSKELKCEDCCQFVTLLDRALSQKNIPYVFWTDGVEMLVESGTRNMIVSLDDVGDGVYNKDISTFVNFILKISPLEIELPGFSK